METDPFQAAQAQHVGKKKCPVERVLSQLADEDDGEEKLIALNNALDAPKDEIYGTVIQKVLSDWGFAVGQYAVQRHRRHACGCYS